MKKDKKEELKNNSKENAIKYANTIRENLAKLRFELRSGKTANIKDIKSLRKELAVVLTIKNQQKKK